VSGPIFACTSNRRSPPGPGGPMQTLRGCLHLHGAFWPGLQHRASCFGRSCARVFVVNSRNAVLPAEAKLSNHQSKILMTWTQSSGDGPTLITATCAGVPPVPLHQCLRLRQGQLVPQVLLGGEARHAGVRQHARAQGGLHEVHQPARAGGGLGGVRPLQALGAPDLRPVQQRPQQRQCHLHVPGLPLRR